ncbi:MAG: IS91 family transposase [Deltaproteobacteria bacterium]|nr:IS91 family transposase [Deltaproteobacteria bacterium]
MASTSSLEVADIFRAYGPRFRGQHAGRLLLSQLKAMSAIETCRTSVLGGHVYECDQCREQRIAYNPCRNRHCPKCQGAERFRWLEARQQELLPVEYFHIVFTIPAELRSLALRNQKILYNLLFRSASGALLEVATDPKHLGARLGLLAVLHTWGQQLTHHPHVHCIVPGGGLSPAGDRWVSARPGFLVPVRVLGRIFRGKYLAGLEAAYKAGQLALVGAVSDLASTPRFAEFLDKLYQQEWVVYSKRPFAGPETVLKYLAGYTHRVAISNQRLLRLEGETVVLSYRDYRRRGRRRLLRLPSEEFIRRFLQHVLPEGFVRIRYYGLFANRHRAENLERCRGLLGVDSQVKLVPPTETRQPQICPNCGEGSLKIEGQISASIEARGPVQERAPPCRAA